MFKPGSMHQVVPAGKYGSAEIVHDTPSSFERMRGSMKGMPLYCEVYTRLLINGRTWMTDAEFEWRSNIAPVQNAFGDVLVGGLGIGFMIHPLVSKVEVRSVTVIERSPDVIALVGPSFPTVNIINADVREWEPVKNSFDCCYLDILPNVPNRDNWEEIKQLKRRYRKAVRKDGWVAVWCEGQAKK